MSDGIDLSSYLFPDLSQGRQPQAPLLVNPVYKATNVFLPGCGIKDLCKNGDLTTSAYSAYGSGWGGKNSGKTFAYVGTEFAGSNFGLPWTGSTYSCCLIVFGIANSAYAFGDTNNGIRISSGYPNVRVGSNNVASSSFALMYGSVIFCRYQQGNYVISHNTPLGQFDFVTSGATYGDSHPPILNITNNAQHSLVIQWQDVSPTDDQIKELVKNPYKIFLDQPFISFPSVIQTNNNQPVSYIDASPYLWPNITQNRQPDPGTKTTDKRVVIAALSNTPHTVSENFSSKMTYGANLITTTGVWGTSLGTSSGTNLAITADKNFSFRNGGNDLCVVVVLNVLYGNYSAPVLEMLRTIGDGYSGGVVIKSYYDLVEAQFLEVYSGTNIQIASTTKGVPAVIIFRRIGSNLSLFVQYTNGTLSTASGTDTTRNVQTNASSSFGFGGGNQVAGAYILEGTVSDGEVSDLLLNPYKVFQPQTLPISVRQSYPQFNADITNYVWPYVSQNVQSPDTVSPHWELPILTKCLGVWVGYSPKLVLIPGGTNTASEISGSWTTFPNTSGVASSTTGDTNYTRFILDNDSSGSSSKNSFLVIASASSVNNTAQYVGGLRNSTLGRTVIGIRFGDGTNSRINATFDNTGAGNFVVSADADYIANKVYTILAVQIGGVGYLYINGILQTSTVSITGTPVTGGYFYSMGFYGQSTSAKTISTTLEVGWNRELTTQEGQDITSSPWQLFSAPNSIIYSNVPTALVSHTTTPSYPGVGIDISTYLYPEVLNNRQPPTSLLSINKENEVVKSGFIPKNLWIPAGWGAAEIVLGAHAFSKQANVTMAAKNGGIGIQGDGSLTSAISGFQTPAGAVDYTGLSGITLFSIVTFNSSTNNANNEGEILRVDNNSSTGQAHVSISVFCNTSGGYVVRTAIATSGTSAWSVGVDVNVGTPTLGIPYTVIGYYDSVAQHVYVGFGKVGHPLSWGNSANAYSGTVTVTSGSVTNFQTHICGGGYVGLTSFPGVVYMVGVIPKVISRGLMQQWSNNPWQIISPQSLTVSEPTLIAPYTVHPISDVSNAGWYPSSGNSLYSMIGETNYNDTTYDYARGAGKVEEIKLDIATIPIGLSPTLSYRYQVTDTSSPVGNIRLQVELLQNYTVLQTWTHSNIGTSVVEAVQTVTATITDSTDLRLRFTTY